MDDFKGNDVLLGSGMARSVVPQWHASRSSVVLDVGGRDVFLFESVAAPGADGDDVEDAIIYW